MNEFTLGRHEQALADLGTRTVRIEAKLDAIGDLLAERKGERKMITLVASSVGGLMSFIITVLLKAWHHG